MKIIFKIDYKTEPGKDLYICGSSTHLGEWDYRKALRMECFNISEWKLELNIQKTENTNFEYNYFLADKEFANLTWENGKKRKLELDKFDFDGIEIEDFWKEGKKEKELLYRSVFSEAIFRTSRIDRQSPELKFSDNEHIGIKFQVNAPKLAPGHQLCLIGNREELRGWNFSDPLPMKNISPSKWELNLQFSKKNKIPGFYKYGIYDPKQKKIISLEKGKDRKIVFFNSKGDFNDILKIDGELRYSTDKWYGAGVSIPVFSLRSKYDMGVGEFTDIKLLVDWCKKNGLKMIQVLPVNDTTHTFTWRDSYPYSGISVFALHPIYLNIQKIDTLPPKITKEEINQKCYELNQNPSLDYETVIKIKLYYCKIAYDSGKESVLNSKEFKEFFEENKEWLKPYAAYSYLRDIYGTFNFEKWGKYSKYDSDLIDSLVSPQSEEYYKIAFYYFLQFYLHKQLLEAAEYARENGVALKGDLPIGVNRYGADAWENPELFRLHCQAGAPPDDFALEGQNWGFPTYNWEEMRKNNFQWWRKRFKHLSKYFDAFRIDHILGFFRIWEIPSEAVTAVLGYFRPSKPIHISELEALDIGFKEERFCKPYITKENLIKRFGEVSAQNLIDNYLVEYEKGFYKLTPEYNTQYKVKQEFELTAEIEYDEEEKRKNEEVKKQLFELLSEILFIKDPDKKDYYHPRISIKRTQSFKDLDDNIKDKIYRLYVEYYYHRQDDLWKEQAMIKLPALINSTNMLICGEDLGMIPDCVPPVLKNIGILSLKIQRMPNEEWLEFGIPKNYPYLSVCTSSSHDMPTLRGWWEENKKTREKFYSDFLGYSGEVPEKCPPWIIDEILMQHLNSPSMLAIFPLQDLVGTNAEIRRENPQEEQINDPSNPDHYWKYRFHISLEDLIGKDDLNNHIYNMIKKSKRDIVKY